MASSRPQYHRSTSSSHRENKSYDNVSRQYLPTQDHRSRTRRPRSPSRVRPRYPSNCGRRRWPPSPKVEEVKFEEEIPMRGKVGQNPMIIDVPSSTSSDSASDSSRDSDDSSGPETPPTDSDHRDRRYIWKPEPDVPIPQSYEEVSNSQPSGQKPANKATESGRGRKTVPKIDTDVDPPAERPPPLERARSPYASGPQDRKIRSDRFSREYLLSPDLMSPRKPYADSPRNQYIPRPSLPNHPPGPTEERRRETLRPSMATHRSHSHYIPRPIEVHNGVSQVVESSRSRLPPNIDNRPSNLPCPDDPLYRNERPEIDSNSLRRPTRPALDRRASDLPYQSSPTSASGNRPRRRNPDGSLEDSDSDSARSRGSSGKTSPQITSRNSTATSSNTNRHHERRFSSEVPLSPRHHQRKLSSELPPIVRHHQRKFSTELPASPLRQSIPSSDVGGPRVNLSSLVSGAAITQTLNTMLKGDHSAVRKASPRSTPRVSPTTTPLASPFTSPPRTPPSEPSGHRANPILGLKQDSPNSRPSSPLSSRSSLWTAQPEDSSRERINYERSRAAPVSRKTTPLPDSSAEKPKDPGLLTTPGITVRSPSPAKHAKSLSAESKEAQYSRQIPREEPSDRHSRSSNLAPTARPTRQRSASSADVRPRLTVHTGAPSQVSDTAHVAKPSSRPASPNPITPGQRYKPSDTESVTSATGSLRPGIVSSTNRARSKSRSYVPHTPVAEKETLSTPISDVRAARPKSSVPAPASPAIRTMASAPSPATHALTPISPANLPQCPRSKAATGYDDWSMLRVSTNFAVCPSCCDSVFGSRKEVLLQPCPEASSRKTLCSLNSPWVRLALSLPGQTTKTLSALSDVTFKERSCPGDELAPRDWYRLEDNENGKHIPGFNVCPHCVHSLETLLPSWDDVFYRPRSSQSHELRERFCGLRASPNRFGDFLNMMIDSVQQADSKRKHPNTTPVCELAKQLAAIDECPKDKMFPRKSWHIHPHLPEFTICQECYESVVYPLVQQGAALAAKIDKKPHQFPNPETEVCCHLYSPRMRRVFREACDDDDYEHLRRTVLKRHMLQQDILGTFREMREHPGDREVDGRLRELLERWKDRE